MLVFHLVFVTVIKFTLQWIGCVDAENCTNVEFIGEEDRA